MPCPWCWSSIRYAPIARPVSKPLSEPLPRLKCMPIKLQPKDQARRGLSSPREDGNLASDTVTHTPCHYDITDVHGRACGRVDPKLSASRGLRGVPRTDLVGNAAVASISSKPPRVGAGCAGSFPVTPHKGGLSFWSSLPSRFRFKVQC